MLAGNLLHVNLSTIGQQCGANGKELWVKSAVVSTSALQCLIKVDRAKVLILFSTHIYSFFLIRLATSLGFQHDLSWHTLIKTTVSIMQGQQSLIISVALAEKTGLNEAIILHQLLYWQEKLGRHEWIYNSYKAWQQQFRFLSLRTIRRAFVSLEKQGFLESKRSRKCKFYRLHNEFISTAIEDSEIVGPNLEDDSFTAKDQDSISAVSSKSEVEATRETCHEDQLKQMLEIWERQISTAGQTLTLTPQRESKLRTLFVNTFESKPERWQSVVDKIAGSEFLMGKITNFKASFDWAIIPENCIKILEGTYSKQGAYCTTVVSMNKIQESVNASIELIENKNWRETSRLLTRILSPGEYQSWLGRTKFEKYENNIIYLEAELKFIADWIDGHYTHKIRRAWHEATQENLSRIIVRPPKLSLIYN